MKGITCNAESYTHSVDHPSLSLWMICKLKQSGYYYIVKRQTGKLYCMIMRRSTIRNAWAEGGSLSSDAQLHRDLVVQTRRYNAGRQADSEAGVQPANKARAPTSLTGMHARFTLSTKISFVDAITAWCRSKTLLNLECLVPRILHAYNKTALFWQQTQR